MLSLHLLIIVQKCSNKYPHAHLYLFPQLERESVHNNIHSADIMYSSLHSSDEATTQNFWDDLGFGGGQGQECLECFCHKSFSSYCSVDIFELKVPCHASQE